MYTGTNFTTLVLGYGFIMGAGIGMGYQVPLAVAGNWATDENRPRYLGGVVSGFGLSSILVAFAVAPRFADLFGYVGLDYAPLFVLYDPAEVGFSDVFGLFALIAAAATILSAVLLKDPPSVTRASVDPTHLTPKGMLKTRSYIINMLIGTAGFGAGIMVISFAKKYPEDAMIAAGIPDVVAGIAGIIAVVLLFFGNMYGRYFWGWVQTMVKKYLRHKAWVDDLVVAKWVMMSVLGIQALGMLALAVTPSMPVLLAANLFLIGLCFGGMFVVMPNLTIAMFGKSYWSANYPVNFLSYGIAAILLGIVVGGILADMSVSYSIGSTSALLVVAAAAVPLLRKEFGPKTENLKLVEDAA
jgi:OFA family oxalate/formate antiporter-like MFS transporter